MHAAALHSAINC